MIVDHDNKCWHNGSNDFYQILLSRLGWRCHIGVISSWTFFGQGVEPRACSRVRWAWSLEGSFSFFGICWAWAMRILSLSPSKPGTLLQDLCSNILETRKSTKLSVVFNWVKYYIVIRDISDRIFIPLDMYIQFCVVRYCYAINSMEKRHPFSLLMGQWQPPHRHSPCCWWL